VSNKNPESFSKMKAGDVLVSHPTAVREHEISVIPNAPHATSPTHDEAVSDGRSEADILGVDAWLTEDHTHVVKIASHRAPDKWIQARPCAEWDTAAPLRLTLVHAISRIPEARLRKP
jgi:hypothetical protein